MTQNLFVYGSLMCAEVVKRVLGRVPEMVQASAKGVRRHAIQGVSYPGTKHADGVVTGRILKGITDPELHILDDFEGEQYSRSQIETLLADGSVCLCETYLWLEPAKVLNEDWDFEEFQKSHLGTFFHEIDQEMEQRGSKRMKSDTAAEDPSAGGGCSSGSSSSSSSSAGASGTIAAATEVASMPRYTRAAFKELQNVAKAEPEKWFAVHPLRTCPHLMYAVNLEGLSVDISAPCTFTDKNDGQVCGNVGENMLCLKCHAVHCGRYVKGHMIEHNEHSPASHAVVCSFADLSFWCYACEQYINPANPMLWPVFVAVHMAKFGSAPPS